MWDAHAVSLGLPLGVAMGGGARTIPLYGSGGYHPKQTVEEVKAQIDAHREQGFSAVKLRLSGVPGDASLLRAAKDACSDSINLMVDLNEKTTLTQARQIIDLSIELGVLFVEEPLASANIQGYRDLARAYPGMIATGEHLQGAVEAAPFLNDRLCAVIQPDLAMMGGLSEALRVARWAENVGIDVMPHFLPGLFIHLAAVAPNLNWLEDFPFLEPLLEGLPEVMNGTMSLPASPGHGLSMPTEIR